MPNIGKRSGRGTLHVQEASYTYLAPVLGGSLDEGQIPISYQLGYIVTYLLVLKILK
jgi:hypothetical protein